jgi:hypothetical protein
MAAMRNAFNIFVSMFEREREGERDHLEDLGVDERTLNWIFKETGLVGMAWINLTQNRGDGGTM